MLYVADFNVPRIAAYRFWDLTHAFDFTSVFKGPHSIEERDGFLYINYYYEKEVVKYTLDGQMVSTPLMWGQGRPWCLTGPGQTQCDPEGNFIVSDYGSDSLQKFSPKGQFLGWMGRNKEGYFSQWSNQSSPVKSSNEGGFDRPHSVAFDHLQRMFVADSWNDRIQIFDKDGLYLDTLKGFSKPVSVSIEDELLVVADTGANRVVGMTLEGDLLFEKTGLKMPYDARVKDGHLLIADSDNQCVRVYSSSSISS